MRLIRVRVRRLRRRGPTSLQGHYRAYRPDLRREFGGVCAYCGLPDAHLSPRRFHVDHYRPKGGPSAFPALTHEYKNLFWACEVCNLAKSTYWPRNTGEARVVNPCDDSMAAHLRLTGSAQQPRIEGRSLRGAFTAELLAMTSRRADDNRAEYVLHAQALEDRRVALVARLRRARARPDLVKPLREQLRLVEAQIRRYAGADLDPLPMTRRSRRGRASPRG